MPGIWEDVVIAAKPTASGVCLKCAKTRHMNYTKRYTDNEVKQGDKEHWQNSYGDMNKGIDTVTYKMSEF